MRKFLFASVISFLVFGVSLSFAISKGIRSQEWTPTPGKIAESGHTRNTRRRRIRWRQVKVEYSFKGKQFLRHADFFGDRASTSEGTQLTIFVNPDRPTEMATAKGFVAIDYGIPLAGTLGSAAMSIVILCVMFSPKDDYESSFNDSLI